MKKIEPSFRYIAEHRYSFYCHGHPNIRAKHDKTIEFTKDSDISKKADCIIGINADFDPDKLKQFQGGILLTVETVQYRDEFHAVVNPGFNDNREMVLRKGKYTSPRTFGLMLNKGASGLKRDMAINMRNHSGVMKVTIYSKPVQKEQSDVCITGLYRVIGKKLQSITRDELDAVSALYERVVLDIGTGSGKFIYRCAKNNPKDFFIGIETSHKSVLDSARRTMKKPSRGGISNLIYLITNIETPPAELAGIADEIYINYPWGRLLAGIVRAEKSIINSIRNLLKTRGKLNITFSYDRKYEPHFIDGYSLPDMNMEYVQNTMAVKYRESGLTLLSVEILTSEDIVKGMSDWGRRIGNARERTAWMMSLIREC